ncbi:MAG: DUF4332 domain-containing protein [Chloroflexota bacterium]
MESNTKHLLAVFSLMLGLSWGVPYIVSDEKNTSWLMLAIIFLALALAFWFWIMRDQRTAEEAAEDAVDAAEENLKKLEAKAEDAVDAGGAAIREPSEVPTSEKDIQPSAAPSASMPSTSSEAEVEEALAQAVPVVEEVSADDEPEDTEADDTAVADEPLEERVEPEPVEALVEDAKEGDPIAESTIAEVTAASPEAVDVPVEVEIDDEPEPIAETEPESASDEPDDLTRIEGIGPKYAEILIGAGVDTFAKIAEMDTDAIVTLVRDNGGRKSGSMATWVEQAKLAAAGDWDALDTLQDELSGGRR